MDSTGYFHYMAALVFVLGAMLALAWVLKRFVSGDASFRPLMRRGAKRRLRVEESLALDARRRVLLVRRDDVLHLVLIGGGNDILLETLPADGSAPSVSGDGDFARFLHDETVSPSAMTEKPGTAP
ncbi:flagellar biosynthetic protein FliO [Phaeovibrio sulfidiphilus]|uniref:Flagellar biosynthetic protein FliO n=1 Tax=Phaeovibrio sulfidiphilus TaxID=1220600 RepID=A0A8J6YMB7_9PROT|nr:flagellar biosynthetic protein FliO [Phaeovibrio sulfidiphilus]MBE1237055.1 flagellar biosynthetic protein FliO [Phaeovibrio sulfidiphilus]